MKEAKEKLTLSMDAELLRKLKKLAKIDRRSLSNYVGLVLENHIERTKEG